MKSIDLYYELERERRKLIQLIIDAKKLGIPIIKNDAILAQSRKVDASILKTPPHYIFRI
jgi:hypothetical protein